MLARREVPLLCPQLECAVRLAPPFTEALASLYAIVYFSSAVSLKTSNMLFAGVFTFLSLGLVMLTLIATYVRKKANWY